MWLNVSEYICMCVFAVGFVAAVRGVYILSIAATIFCRSCRVGSYACRTLINTHKYIYTHMYTYIRFHVGMCLQ